MFLGGRVPCREARSRPRDHGTVSKFSHLTEDGRRWLPYRRTMTTPPDTIVLLHGFWVTPRSWEDWKAHYEAKGFRVLTPAYPGFEVEVEALREDPTPIEAVTAPGIIDHFASVIR